MRNFAGRVLLPAVFIAGQATATAQTPGLDQRAAVRQQINDFYKAWSRARMDLDSAAMNRMTSSDFYVQVGPQHLSKQEFVQQSSGPPAQGYRMSRYDVTVDVVYPRDSSWVAVIEEKLEFEATANPAQKSYSLWITRDSFRKTANGWVATASETIGSEAWGAGRKPPLADWTSAEEIPTTFDADRIFSEAVTVSGDTVRLLLDTGDRSRVFVDGVRRQRWQTDSVASVRGGFLQVATLPKFAPGHGLPEMTEMRTVGRRILLGPPTDAFDTLMARRTVGQLGFDWFADRIWTFDYQHKRLLLHSEMPARDPRDREIAFDFRTDTAGTILAKVPRLQVEVDGDSLLLIFDTGATVWLTDGALAAVHDGLPAERSWNLVRKSTLDKWHARHPTWRFIEHAALLNGSDIIEVPKIRVAGVEVGPVWFGTIPDMAPNVVISKHWWIDGTLGGSTLQYFTTTLDYPHMIARLRPVR